MSALRSSLLRFSTSSSLFAKSSVPKTSPSRASSINTTRKMSTTSFFDAVKTRRTYYALNKESSIPDSKIESLVNETVLHTPSSFNSQSSRLVVLLNEDHDKFWELTKEALKPMVSAEQFEGTSKKLDGFKAGYGTILFFENQPSIKGLQEKFALYADKFPQWSEHTSAMHQFVLWTALETEGLGANLQHYNPVVDEKVQQTWGVSKDWELKAQLVFGGRAGEPGEKSFMPLEERVKIFGKSK